MKKLLSILLILAVVTMQTVPVVLAQEATVTPEPTGSIESTTSTDTSSTTSVDESSQTTNNESSTNQEPQGTTAVSPSPTPTPNPYHEEGDVNRTSSMSSATSLGVNPTPTPTSGGSTSISTGDATTTASGATIGNANLAGGQAGGSTSGSGATVSNAGNGSGSDNSGSAIIDNDSATIQDNSATINNNLNAGSTTGSNTTSGNTGTNSNITTGDANTSGTLVTAVNTNAAGIMVSEFNITDDHTGDYVLDFAANCILGCTPGTAIVQNTGNGSNSDNSGDITIDNDASTIQNNDANIGNDMTLSADSGYNDASQNTGGDTRIETGDANVSANVLTFANNNIAGNVVVGIVNIFGDLIGDIIFPEDQMGTCCATGATASNTGNGSGSTNDGSVVIDNESDILQNNDADINNNLNFDATTGNNESSGNTGGNTGIETGDTFIDANLLNIANMNLVGGNMWLVLVNEAGEWVGKIMGATEGLNFAGSEGLGFTVDENGFIRASNTGNGSGSTNDASVSQSNTSTTEQNNTADINNNLNLSANTGYNTASDNTGGNTFIKTGDAQILANLVNFVNNNIVGDGKLFVTVVNVFGSWMGDFVSPGHKKEAKPAENNTSSNHNSNQNNTQSSTSTTSTNSQVKGAHAELTYSPTLTNKVAGVFGAFTGSSQVVSDTSLETEGGATAMVKDAQYSKPSPVESLSKGITINLAWLIVLAPVILLIVKAKQLVTKTLPR